MKRKIVIYTCWALLILLATSCSSMKKISKSDAGAFSETEHMEKMLSRTSEWDAVTAKMSVELNLNGRNTGKVNGSLRIKRGEVIQILLVPFLGIEVGRIEISPEGLLVIDRMNKRYTQIGFDELNTRIQVGLSYFTLESLFLNEVFLPEKGKLTMRDKSLFDWVVALPEIVLSTKKPKALSCRFLTKAPEGWLNETHIGLMGVSYALNWKYDNFKPLEQSVFPTYMKMSFEGVKNPIAVTFNLSRLSTDNDWEVHTNILRKYEAVELEEVIKMLLK